MFYNYFIYCTFTLLFIALFLLKILYHLDTVGLVILIPQLLIAWFMIVIKVAEARPSCLS